MSWRLEVDYASPGAGSSQDFDMRDCDAATLFVTATNGAITVSVAVPANGLQASTLPWNLFQIANTVAVALSNTLVMQFNRQTPNFAIANAFSPAAGAFATNWPMLPAIRVSGVGFAYIAVLYRWYDSK